MSITPSETNPVNTQREVLTHLIPLLQRYLVLLQQDAKTLAETELPLPWTSQTQGTLEEIEASVRALRLTTLDPSLGDPNEGFFLDTTRRCWISYKDLIGEVAAIFGMRGSGKSNTVALLLEHLLRRNVPVLVIDPHGEYYSLRALPVRLLVIGIIGGAASSPDLLITPEQAGVVAEYSLRSGVSIILDLSGLQKAQQHNVLSEFLETIWAIAPQTKRPYEIFMEEAHSYMPERGKSPVAEIISDLATEYRKFGVGMAVIDQRPANVKKTPISQARVRILHQVEYPLDVKRYREIIPAREKKMEQILETFEEGTALVKVHKRIDVIQVRERETVHVGSTPTLDGTTTTVEIIHDEALIRDLREAITAAPPRSSIEGLSASGARRLQEALERLERISQQAEQLERENFLLREQLGRLLGLIQTQAPMLLLTEGGKNKNLTLDVIGARDELPTVLDIRQATIAHVEIASLTSLEEPVAEEKSSDLLTLTTALQEAQQQLRERESELGKTMEELRRVQHQVERLERAQPVLEIAEDEERQAPPTLTNRQEQAVQRLILDLQARLDLFQLQVFHLLLLENELSAPALATRVGKRREQMKNARATELVALGLVTRLAGGGYRLRLEAYCQSQLNNAPAEQVRTYLLKHMGQKRGRS